MILLFKYRLCHHLWFHFVLLLFGGGGDASKITADGDCSHETKRQLLLGRKALTNLDSILQSRDISSPTQVSLGRATLFQIVMYGYESWTTRKAEPQRIDAFELLCWRRLLRVPWIARRSNQFILKEISPEYSLRKTAEAETLILWPPDERNEYCK